MIIKCDALPWLLYTMRSWKGWSSRGGAIFGLLSISFGGAAQHGDSSDSQTLFGRCLYLILAHVCVNGSLCDCTIRTGPFGGDDTVRPFRPFFSKLIPKDDIIKILKNNTNIKKYTSVQTATDTQRHIYVCRDIGKGNIKSTWVSGWAWNFVGTLFCYGTWHKATGPPLHRHKLFLHVSL